MVVLRTLVFRIVQLCVYLVLTKAYWITLLKNEHSEQLANTMMVRTYLEFGLSTRLWCCF